VSIDKEDFVNALWFATSSGSQTYPRTLKSKDDYIWHLYRIFIGKIGELTFLRWAYKINLVNQYSYEEHIKTALSIFYGQTNVDSYDIKINNITIDVKTVPSDKYKYLIVPLDQWIHQRKDYYIALAVNIKKTLIDEICKLPICASRSDIQSFVNKIHNINCFQSLIKGFLPRTSNLWKRAKSDKYCPEKECVRAELDKIQPIKAFIAAIQQLKYQ